MNIQFSHHHLLKVKVKVKVTQSCPTLCDPVAVAHQAPLSMGFFIKNTGVGCHALLQGIFPTQESNPGHLHCRWILYQLSHQGSPRILEWVAYPYPGDLPNPGVKPRFPALWAYSLPAEPPRKPKNTGVGSLSLLQGIFLTQGSNQGLLYCRGSFYQLNYQRNSMQYITSP